MRLERLPVESREPLVSFAVIRALLATAAVAALAILDFPYAGLATVVLAAVALPWSLGVLAVTRRNSKLGLSLIVPVGDFAILGLLLAVEPDTYVSVHFIALFLVAAHAHFQGERGLVVGIVAPAALVPVTLLVDVPVRDGMLEAYEVLFAVSSLSAALVLGQLRTAESTGRLRALALSRRTIDNESEVRRRLSEAIHDGAVQQLVSAELMLASAEQALAKGDTDEGRSILDDARQLTRQNIVFLRDEIVQLGPHAFEELTLEEAIGSCRETWERRHGFKVVADASNETLSPEVAGPLFRITQEAVTNAGKHADASEVRIRLRQDRGTTTLEVADNGRGFGDVDPLGAAEPGHIGLASMRERAEMLGGLLAIQSDGDGTRVLVTLPL